MTRETTLSDQPSTRVKLSPGGGGGGGYATRGVAGTFLQLGTVFQIVLSVLLSFGVQMYFDSFVRFA